MKRTHDKEHKDGFTRLLAGPVVWLLFFVLAYAVTGLGCDLAGGQGSGDAGVTRWLVMVMAVIAAVVIVMAGSRALLQWRRADYTTSDRDARRRFVDLAGLGLCAASVVGVIWLAVGFLIHPLC